jgi:hypothetical protein
VKSDSAAKSDSSAKPTAATDSAPPVKRDTTTPPLR